MYNRRSRYTRRYTRRYKGVGDILPEYDALYTVLTELKNIERDRKRTNVPDFIETIVVDRFPQSRELVDLSGQLSDLYRVFNKLVAQFIVAVEDRMEELERKGEALEMR